MTSKRIRPRTRASQRTRSVVTATLCPVMHASREQAQQRRDVVKSLETPYGLDDLLRDRKDLRIASAAALESAPLMRLRATPAQRRTAG